MGPIEVARLNQAQRTAGRRLSYLEAGAIIGVTLIGLAVAVTRMVKMDRPFRTILITGSSIATTGAAIYLGARMGGL